MIAIINRFSDATAFKYHLHDPPLRGSIKTFSRKLNNNDKRIRGKYDT
ncbi:hypothetical protein [Enterobacter hormaechei]|nr:hypothetical protein [Enterobacter hormaechei]